MFMPDFGAPLETQPQRTMFFSFYVLLNKVGSFCSIGLLLSGKLPDYHAFLY